MNKLALFDEVKGLTVQATEQVKSNKISEFQEIAGRIKNLIETGELPG